MDLTEMKDAGTTTLPTSNSATVAVELGYSKERAIGPESKQRVIGDNTWEVSSGDDCYKLEEMTVTLFRAHNDDGSYKSYLTFSAFASSLGWSTDHTKPYPNAGIYLYTKLLNDGGGVLLQWDIPVIDIKCPDNRVPIFFQKDNVDPDIYDLVTQCTFGQAKPNAGLHC